MDIKDIIKNAKQELVELTGFTSPVVIGVDKQDQVWRITIEITEKTSPAPNLEILGIYEVRCAAKGGFLGYERVGMRKRGEIRR